MSRFGKRNKGRRYICIGGYAGCGNLGDDAILQGWLEKTCGVRERRRIILLSGAPRRDRRRFGVRCVHRKNPFGILWAFGRSQRFDCGGGSLLQNATGNASLFYYLFLLLLARRMGCETRLLAAGIGPIRGRLPMKMTVHILKKCEKLRLRDEASQRFLLEAGIPVDAMELTADPATYLRTPPANRLAYCLLEAGIPAHAPYFCVALQGGGGRAEAIYRQKLGAAIRLFARAHGLMPLFLTLDRRQDEGITSALCASVGGRVARLREARDALSCVSGCRFLISMRLHGLIFASMTGKPAIGISATEDEPKLAEFCRAHGFPHFGALDWSVAAMIEAMERAVERRS